MYPEDEEKTAFITEYGLYCWKVMPFGLKNVGATYQRMVNSIFSTQIGKNKEIYVDNMLVKSKVKVDHLENLRETFEQLRKSKLRINPDKCSFGVTLGKFLGYMISEREIEPNPDKIKEILNMQPPPERALSSKFCWDDECNKPFEELKEYLSSPKLLYQLEPGEVLQLYLAVSEGAISSVLIREAERQQRPVYYVSRVLHGA
ncbi:hypothetical protein LIER_26742 [Lithospermum erythrorhizon]|uniref:Retrovirus-related Pol polyprotein from transposon 17.6 n=1 Tax=Lithospermum erythrorhizon TaxID=34254 RepID=A0AAV3RDI5_LITER